MERKFTRELAVTAKRVAPVDHPVTADPKGQRRWPVAACVAVGPTSRTADGGSPRPTPPTQEGQEEEANHGHLHSRPGCFLLPRSLWRELRHKIVNECCTYSRS